MISDNRKEELGNDFAESLNLKKNCWIPDTYKTNFGNKSALGIFEMINSFKEMILLEEKDSND